ncbi:uncharacterized protein LOC131232526 isoform X1 [Magnolia sinica]|uniref:uncharacterized protein LOC131232526 isoform X1 n=1 Tax=Magnolia sinica TaxID=86752 RepID=UPI00265B38CD|nr:uncharacterized protein LOC131232526 isoform X1 [Magnolia sinica]
MPNLSSFLSSMASHFLCRAPTPATVALLPLLCHHHSSLSSPHSKKLPTLSRTFSTQTPIRASHTSNTLQTLHNDPFIVSKDEKYSNKQVICVTPQLYNYILSNVREPPILRELREETATMRGNQMQVSPDQAQLLAMLVQMLGAQRCIEIGVYTGYSSLAIALVLPESGHLVACERDAKCLEVAKRYYERAGVSHKVDVRHALAADTLKALILNGEACSYDFAFVDAEKRMYHEYFELLLQLVRVGGVIVIDNVLWHGKVADSLVNDPKTIGIRNFNSSIFEDQRISISMVPIGDGMTICRKR